MSIKTISERLSPGGNPPPNHNNNTIDNDADQAENYPHSISGNDYTIGEAFYPIILFLKLVGASTLFVVGRGKIYIPGTKWTISWTLSTLTLFLTLLTFYALNSFGIAWPAQIFVSYLKDNAASVDIHPGNTSVSPTTSLINDPNLFIYITLCLRFFIPYSGLVSGFLGLIHAPGFALFLNKWVEFSQLMKLTFSPHYGVSFEDIRRKRDLHFYLVFMPIILAILGATVQLTLVGEIIHNGREYYFVATLALTMTFSGVLLCLRVASNMKDFLCLIVLSTAYRELRKGAKAQYSDLREGISKAEVQGWLRLAVFIRDQAILIQRQMGPQNIWLLFESFSLSLTVLTASILAIFREQKEYFLVVGVFIAVSCGVILFLFVKAHFADVIAYEEEQFMEAVVEMTGTRNCETRLEMKSLCDMILHRPINITFGNVVVFSKRFILAFCSQLAATLIIILQFI